ncbi:MAG: hypothetical protein EHM23_09580 [Acidobacteria bacterium]|nr:MAG: hypothetical protein EHM23_09580 [Acidobacteriota bacterium]
MVHKTPGRNRRVMWIAAILVSAAPAVSAQDDWVLEPAQSECVYGNDNRTGQMTTMMIVPQHGSHIGLWRQKEPAPTRRPYDAGIEVLQVSNRCLLVTTFQSAIAFAESAIPIKVRDHGRLLAPVGVNGSGNHMFLIDKSDLHVVPFKLVEHLIMVKGSIHDRHDLNLVIDTGASRTLISAELGKQLKLGGETRIVDVFGSRKIVREIEVESVALGRTRFNKVKAYVGRLPYSKLKTRVRIDALIGLDVIRRTSLSIDYLSSRLVFGPITHSEASIPFYDKLPFIPVPIVIGGHRFQLLLDTGAGQLILYERHVGGRVGLRRTGEKRRIVALGNRDASLERVEIGEIQIGQASWKDPPCYLLAGPVSRNGPAGVLGVRALSLKKLNLDFVNKRISWEK